VSDLLATPRQYQWLHGQDEDPTALSVVRALEDASALFRSLASQTISLVENDAVELEGNRSTRLWLPERPVLAVTSVSIETDFSTTSQGVTAYRITRRGLLKLRSGPWWGGLDSTIRVTYSHGYAEIPDDVVAVVCSMAARQLANPTGATSQTLGPRSIAYASVGGDGSTIGLTAEEQRIVRKYRPRFG
jgi:hypothetical protein